MVKNQLTMVGKKINLPWWLKLQNI